MGFEKFNIFARNPKVLAYGFTENCQFGGKNRSKLCISWSRPPYCKSVIYNGPIFQFLRVYKISHFCSKSKGVSLWFYGKLPVCGKNCRNSIFLSHDPRIVNRLSITVPYFNFYGFSKISHFCSKSKGVSLRFYQKIAILGAKTDRNSVFLGRDPRIANWVSIMVPDFNFYGF